MHPAGPAAHSEYTDAAASALPFDPTLDGGLPHPELARATRGPAAFLGFDQGTTESYVRATDDLQTNDFGDFYAQESISVRSGTRIR